MNLLLVSSPVGAIGSPETGGVTTTILNTYECLKDHHNVKILAPSGSDNTIEISGAPQISLLENDKDFYPILPDSIIANMWEWVRSNQSDFDLIINFANDWLPYYLTGFYQTKIIHIVNLAEINNTVSDILLKTDKAFPKQLAAISRSQAETLKLKNHHLLTQGIDEAKYSFIDNTSDDLIWAGRISPEKGVEDACEIAKQTNHKIKICGYIQNKEYWNSILEKYSDTIDYRGMLNQSELQEQLGLSKAMLFTSKWTEAFGQIVIESLACGTPVISYKCGGPEEIIKNGETGFLVNNISDMIGRTAEIKNISRKKCRNYVKSNHSLKNLRKSYEDWFKAVLS